jgi:hypothetical protein
MFPFTRPEPVADPALVSKLCEQAVEIASLKEALEQQRLHPRRNGRFVNRQDAKTEQLRGELQAKHNAPLDEALSAQRLAEKFAPPAMQFSDAGRRG